MRFPLPRRLLLALGLAPGTAAVAASPTRGPAPDLEDALSSILADAVLQGRVVGAVFVVLKHGAELHGDIAGSADREQDVATRRDTIFRLASMTKPIVSAAALALTEEGRLSLEDPVTRWLPAFAPRLPDASRPTITVRHLLTHTAGLGYGFLLPPDNAYARAGVSDGLDQPALSLDENLRRLASVPLLHAPGAAFSYSLATDVLGAVVQAAADAPLPEVVAARVTRKLGMTDTGFAPPDPGRLAKPYTDAGGRLRPVGSPDAIPSATGGVIRADSRRALAPGAYPSGGAGMVGTADDYLRFLEALRTGGAPILRPETTRLMLADAIAGLTIPDEARGFGFGLGVGVVRDRATSARPMPTGAWEWGGAWGTKFWVDPTGAMSVVLLTNTTREGVDGRLPADLRDAVWGG